MPSHLFPAPGDKNRSHYLDDLLLRAFVWFFVFNFTKRTLHIFQISSCLTQLSALQLANRRTHLSSNRLYYVSVPHAGRGRSAKGEKLQSS